MNQRLYSVTISWNGNQSACSYLTLDEASAWAGRMLRSAIASGGPATQFMVQYVHSNLYDVDFMQPTS